MFFFGYQKEKILPILINRSMIFLFFMGLLTLLLYTAGTIQEFIDSTQVSLLRFYTVLGIFLTIVSLCGMILDVSRFLKIKKVRYLLRAGGYILLVIFSVTTVLAAMLIITLST